VFGPREAVRGCALPAKRVAAHPCQKVEHIKEPHAGRLVQVSIQATARGADIWTSGPNVI
jgi:hypothetical protein